MADSEADELDYALDLVRAPGRFGGVPASDRDTVTCPDCLGSGKDPRGEQPWTKYDGDACIVCAGHGKVSPELAVLVIRTREEVARLPEVDAEEGRR